MKEKIFFDIETTGLNPWYGDRITCICLKTSDGKKEVFQYECEGKIIIEFLDYIQQLYNKNNYMLVTKNGKQFDIPFILTRSNINFDIYDNDIDINTFLIKFEHFDIHEITNKWVSLENMAIILGFPENERKTGNGLTAIKLFHAKRYDELISYCMRDVELTEKVYNRIMELRK